MAPETEIDYAPNHHIRRADYVAGLRRELTAATDKAVKAGIQTELDSVLGVTTAVQLTKETA